MNKKIITLIFTVSISLFTSACQNTRPLPTASDVDLPSFMGTWYVIGYTPIVVDKDAHNAIEHYYQEADGTISTTYQYRKGSFDGKLATFTPKGWIYNSETNAEWRMQFVWPFKASYLILHYDESRGETIIGHPNRKYCWIMTREPEYDSADYERLVGKLTDLEFNKDLIKEVPHDWSKEDARKNLMDSEAPRAITKKQAKGLL